MGITAGNYKIILFDGVCNLCNSSVNYIIDRDRSDKFKFTSLQSETGKTFLNRFGLDPEKLFSIILVDGDKYYSKSDAALRIARELGGSIKLMYWFKVFPRFIRDWVYDIIAANRYKWFGKKDSCRIPTPELRKKFLD